jgi:ferredoxin-NADP reductase
MATVRTAQVDRIHRVGVDTCLVDLVPAEPLGFAGGQYVIVDSGLTLASGKAVKRAYSVLSRDDEQARLQLAVKRLPDGPGSSFMHELQPGAELRFSGPWGKLAPRDGATGPVLVLATDTGITAALGLVQGARFAPVAARAVLLWLRTTRDYFLPEALVWERAAVGLGERAIGSLPPVGHPERIPHVRAVVQRLLARVRVEQAFLAGDGAVNYALLGDLVAAGVPATRDSVESFFNMPRRSA